MENIITLKIRVDLSMNLCQFLSRNLYLEMVEKAYLSVIVNSQPPPFQGAIEIEDFRTWTRAVYDGVHFNDYIKFRLVSDIKKRIIINGLTGSSWRFKRFDRLSFSVNNSDDQRVLK